LSRLLQVVEMLVAIWFVASGSAHSRCVAG